MSERLPNNQEQQGGDSSGWDDLAGMHPDDSTSEGGYDYPDPSEKVEELFREETKAFKAANHAAVEQQNESESAGGYQARHMATGQPNSNLRRGRHFKPDASLPEDDDTQEPTEDAPLRGRHFAQQPVGRHMRQAEATPASPEDVKDSSEEADKTQEWTPEDAETARRASVMQERVLNAAAAKQRWEQKTPQEQQAEHDSLVARLEEAKSEKEFWDICKNREYKQAIGQGEIRKLLDGVIIKEAEGEITKLEEDIDALNQGVQRIEAELRTPLRRFLGLVTFGFANRKLKDSLESEQTLIAQDQQKMAAIRSRDSYVWARQRVDSERREQERLNYLANTPVEQMAQDNRALPSEYMKALRDRNEYTLENILLFYNGAKRDNDANAYLAEARKFINNNSSWSDEEKQKQHERVNAAITARTYGDK